MSNTIPGTPSAGNGGDHDLKRIDRILEDIDFLSYVPEGAKEGFELLAEAIEILAKKVKQPTRRLRRLTLHDAAGKDRIVLMADGPEPSIAILAPDGTRRLALVMAEDGSPAVRLYDPAGIPLATLAVARLGVFNEDYADKEGPITAGLILSDGEHAEVKAIASAGLASVEAMTVAKDDRFIGAGIDASRMESYSELAAWNTRGVRFAFRVTPELWSEVRALGTVAG